MAIVWTEENASLESMNAWIHGLGFLLSIPAGYALCLLAAESHPSLVVACMTYGLSLSAMYLFSTLSHAVRSPVWRHRMRAADQGVIYTLIAGTFTPFICDYLVGWSQLALLSFVWIAATAGFYSKVLATHRVNNMTTISYVLLGWVPAMILFSSVSYYCFAMMALGGVLYTAGVFFLQNDHRAWYYHALWHVMVILASACHFAAIAMFAILHWDR